MSSGTLKIPEVPDDWLWLLNAVNRQLPEAFISGGALRDLLLEKPVNDIDIFVSAVDVSETEMEEYIRKVWNIKPQRMGTTGAHLADYDMAVCDVLSVWDQQVPMANGNVYKVQIIALNCPTTQMLADYVLERIDFGVCRIACNSNGDYTIRDEFLQDYLAKTFTLCKCTYPDSHIRRWDRLKVKYPDWQVNWNGLIPEDKLCDWSTLLGDI